MNNQAAIVTLAIGQSFLAYWKTYCERTWIQYAQAHSLDLVVITEPLDTSARATARSPAWQKCLVLSQDFLQKYRRIIWLDIDIAINSHKAPSILDDVPEEKIGGVVSGDCIADDLKLVFLERVRNTTYSYQPGKELWQTDQQRFYETYGIESNTSEIVQSGVLVMSPSYHRELLENVYYNSYPVETRSYEQIPLSYEIMRRDLLARLNSRFNTIFYERMLVHYPYLINKNIPNYGLLARYAVETEFHNSFFLHFAYDPSFVQYLFGMSPTPLESSTASNTDWQQSAYQCLILGDYSQAVTLYEQLIEACPTVMSNYWHLGLVFLLQGEEAQAQATWMLAMLNGEPEQINLWNLELVQVLQTEAKRRQAMADYSTAELIQHYISDITY